MSRIDSTTNSPPGPDEPVTEKIIVPSPTGSFARPTPRSSTGPGATVSLDTTSEPEEWPTRGPANGIRVRWPAAILAALLIAGGGIWGGAALQRSQGSSTTSAASSIASRFAAARGGGASSFGGGAGGASGAAATGIVTEVKGSTLYITNASGGLVEVTLSPSTSVTRNAKTSLNNLKPGDTVVVQGTKGRNGTVSAASVTATAQGVSTGLGGGFSPRG
jgi:hypothetical protein